MRVEIEDGKYTYVSHPDGRAEALRYGETWRDCVGDKFIYCMAAEIEQLRTENESLRQQLAEVMQSPTIYACKQMIHDKAVIEASELHRQLVEVREDAELHKELIMAVAQKFPGESRHETALRYILDRERWSLSGAAVAKWKGEN